MVYSTGPSGIYNLANVTGTTTVSASPRTFVALLLFDIGYMSITGPDLAVTEILTGSLKSQAPKDETGTGSL